MINKDMVVNKISRDVFKLRGNHDIGKTMFIRARICKYKKQQQEVGFPIHPHIEEMDLILRMYLSEIIDNDFEKACDIVAPIFERLGNKEIWSFFDIRLLARIIDYAGDYKQVDKYAQDALEELEHHDTEDLYPSVMRSLYINATANFMRVKHGGINSVLPSEEVHELDELFARYSNTVLHLCRDENLIVTEAVVDIRRAIYYKDKDLAEKAFAVLEEAGKGELYVLMHDEATTYGLYPKDKPAPAFAKEAVPKIRIHTANELLDEMSDKQLDRTIRLLKKVLHEKPAPKKQDDEGKDNGENKKDEGEGDNGKDK